MLELGKVEEEKFVPAVGGGWEQEKKCSLTTCSTHFQVMSVKEWNSTKCKGMQLFAVTTSVSWRTEKKNWGNKFCVHYKQAIKF